MLTNRQIIARALAYIHHEYKDGVVVKGDTVTLNVTPHMWKEGIGMVWADPYGALKQDEHKYLDLADLALNVSPTLKAVDEKIARENALDLGLISAFART